VLGRGIAEEDGTIASQVSNFIQLAGHILPCFKESDPNILALEESPIERLCEEAGAGLRDWPEIAGVGGYSCSNESSSETVTVALVRHESLAACSSSGFTGAFEHQVRRRFPLKVKDVIGREYPIGKPDGARFRRGWIK